MKNPKKFLTILTTILLLSSFKTIQETHFIGTYTVAANDPSQIQLRIEADHTYYFQDFSVADAKIVAKGNWLVKGNKVVLTKSDAGQQFHTVWSFDEAGNVAKSRKRLSFYRLRKTVK
jgi:hypothetical protein